MIKLKEAVIVEGKYDKIKLSNILDCLIITTDGFGIFKDKEKQKFLKRLAVEKGIIILTDSDSAGFMIRNYIQNIVGIENVKNVYIPDIFGKEKRKDAPSSEGKLGVEGISDKIIVDALTKFGVVVLETTETKKELTSYDLFSCGLSGTENSKQRRLMLLKKLDLPERLNTNSLLKILNSFVTYEDFYRIVKELDLCE